MKDRLRVLIVDDSLFMRAAIKKTLEGDGRFEIVGQARDGREGVAKALELQPDVITMDFNMPVMNGAEAVRKIMASRPTPVLMFSAHTRQGARETFEALAAGAVDFVTKPAGEVSTTLTDVGAALAAKVHAAAGARIRPLAPSPPAAPELRHRRTTAPLTATAPSPAAPVPQPRRRTAPLATGDPIAFVAISTGGPVALSRVIPALPECTRLGVVIIQHMPAQFTAALAERLDALSAVEVREAAEGDRPRAGLALIAPGDRHLEVDAGGLLRLTDGPPVNGCRPAADVTMASAARVFGRRAIGLVMTGMGRDGAAGLAEIKAAAGRTLAQDQESSVIFGMPRAAIDLGVVDEILPLDAIAARLASLG